MEKYLNEREGQLDFYSRFLPRIKPEVTVDEILADNNDGVLNGNLLEFKLNVTDLNAVLFQCIKYLSAIRVKGKPVPASIVIVDLNAATAWHFHSEPYLEHIEKLLTKGDEIMADLKIDEARAKIWILDVKRELVAVEHVLDDIKKLNNSVPGSDDTVFQLLEKTSNMMNETWTTTCNAFKKGWDILEEGFGVIAKAGQKIEEAVQELQTQI